MGGPNARGMPVLQLYIGNKNYSSWSLRAWLLLRHCGIAFEEKRLRLDWDEGSDFKKTLYALAPTGRVPLLIDDGFAVWIRWRLPSTWPTCTPRRPCGRATCVSGRGRAASAPKCIPASPSCAAPSA
jgi:glutathione S-transferase